MKITERLLQCKVKLGIKSDYALADKIGINRARIHDYMRGAGKPDAYIAVRIGEILGIHPLILLAEFEAENAKTDERKAFWENFGRRIRTGGLGILALISTAFWYPAREAHAGEPEIRIMYIMSNKIGILSTNRCPPPNPETAAEKLMLLTFQGRR